MPNPDLEVRGGVGHKDPNISGGGSPPKNYFQPFEPQFDLKIRGGGGGAGARPHPWICHGAYTYQPMDWVRISVAKSIWVLSLQVQPYIKSAYQISINFYVKMTIRRGTEVLTT